MKGRLIVIEGTDCSGKETQSKRLVETLNQVGKKAVRLAFPMYDTPTGKIIGGPYLGKPEISNSWFPEGAVNLDPKIACLYYAADRKYNIDKIKTYLDQGYDVIVDRYTSSNMAHQGSKILDPDERFHMYQWIDKLEYWLLELPKPDITIFLHMPYQYSLTLRKNRTSLDEHEKDENHLKQAEEAYIELSELYHWDVIQCVAGQNIKSIDRIANEIYHLLQKKEETR